MKYEPITSEPQFRSRIALGATTESISLDFKYDLDRWRAPQDAERHKGQLELCRDVAQFANTWGGTLLLGVSERLLNGVKVADRISDLREFDPRREWIEQALHNCLVPNTTTRHIDKIQLSPELVIAINVPPSEHLVSVFDPAAGTIECMFRTNHGKDRMNPDAVEAHLMNNTRAAKLALDRVQSSTTLKDVDLASGLWRYQQRGNANSLERIPTDVVRIGSIDENDFELRFANIPVRIPYGLLREAWLTADQRIGIFLHVRVVAGKNDERTLEPF